MSYIASSSLDFAGFSVRDRGYDGRSGYCLGDPMNYGELKQTVADYIHRSDLTAMMPTFIELAHARIMRDVRVPGMLEDSTLVMGTGATALPAGFLDMRELSNTGPVRRYNLKSVGRAQLNEYTAATGGLPIAYSIIGNNIEIQPAAAVSLRIIYFKRFDMFVNDTDTNSILTLNPYLYCLRGAYRGEQLHSGR